MSNVIKHAGTQNVGISIGLTSSGQMMIEVPDDGCGFVPHETPLGLGILTMQDYTGALGGSVTVDSDIGHGTAVRAFIPVQM